MQPFSPILKDLKWLGVCASIFTQCRDGESFLRDSYLLVGLVTKKNVSLKFLFENTYKEIDILNENQSTNWC